MTTDADKRTHTPAAENVWYNLLTIAGEIEAETSVLSDRSIDKRNAILRANRRFWNGYFRHCLQGKDRIHFGDALPRLDDTKLAHIHHVMAKRGFDSLPTDVSEVDLGFADAGAQDLVLDGFCFQSLNCRNTKTHGSIDLHHAKIDGDVDLSHAQIAGSVRFIEAMIVGYVRLRGVKIAGLVALGGAKVGRNVILSSAKIADSVTLIDATIIGSVTLREAEIDGYADLEDARIAGSVDVAQAKIDGPLKLESAQIGMDISCLHTSAQGLNFTAVTCGHADFTDAQFSGPCDFQNTYFREVPTFFGTQLHEDTNWRGVTWPKAETDKELAAERIRRYDRLRLIMSQLKKPVEEQHFQALSLREQRMRDGVTLPSLLNWLYDHGWEYGYGLSKATGLWLGHILLGAIAIGFTQASATGSWVDKLVAKVVEPVTWLSVSFSNSMPFLGLHRGGLKPLYEHFGDCVPNANSLCAFGVLWAVQGVLGTVLFFFLLVTVRNVYRL